MGYEVQWVLVLGASLVEERVYTSEISNRRVDIVCEGKRESSSVLCEMT